MSKRITAPRFIDIFVLYPMFILCSNFILCNFYFFLYFFVFFGVFLILLCSMFILCSILCSKFKLRGPFELQEFNSISLIFLFPQLEPTYAHLQSLTVHKFLSKSVFKSFKLLRASSKFYPHKLIDYQLVTTEFIFKSLI